MAFNDLEIQLASSILYYDREELNNFIPQYDSIIENENFTIDGMFITFMDFLKKFKKQSYEREELIEYLNVCKETMANAKLRDNFSLWLEQAISLDVPMELAEDIANHFVWEQFKQAIATIDKKNISFEDKLSIRPQIINPSKKNAMLSIDDVDISEEEEDSLHFTTGLVELDTMIDMVPTNFVVIAARPSVGKSAMMLQSAIENAKLGYQCSFISFEMSEKSVVKRICNYLAGENLEDKNTDDFGKIDYKRYKEDVDKIKSTKLYKLVSKNLTIIVNKQSNADTILEQLEMTIKERKIQAIFLDYLQLLKFPRVDEWASLRLATSALKSLAFRNNILVMTGSQVSRSSTEKGLDLTSLFGSSTIEADADIIVGLEQLRERIKGEMGKVNVKALKNREGDLGGLKHNVDYSIGKFEYDE